MQRCAQLAHPCGVPGQCAKQCLYQLGHQHHDDHAKHRPHRAPHAANDQGGNKVQRQRQFKLFRQDAGKEIGEQRPRQSTIGRRDGKAGQLVAQQRNAKNFSGVIAVANGDERPANAGADQVLGRQQGDEANHRDHAKHLAFGIQHPAKEVRAVGGQAHHAARPTGKGILFNQENHNEVRRQSGNRQIQPLHPQ